MDLFKEILEIIAYNIRYALSRLKEKVYEKIRYREFNKLFGILFFAQLLSLPINSYVFTLPLIILSVCLLVISLFHILPIRKESLKSYYSAIAGWALFLFFENGFITLVAFDLEGWKKISFVITTFCFIMIVYFYFRLFMILFLTSWGRYAIFFVFILPVPSFLLAAFGISMFLSSYQIMVSSNISIYSIIIGMILLMNFVIYKTNEDTLPEAKVATYLTLALSSTLVYLQDDILNFLSNQLINNEPSIHLLPQKYINMLYEQLRSFIKLACMPYAIGTVFGCFVIEYKELQFKKAKKDKESIADIERKNHVSL